MTGENTTRRRILVVDDEADFAELVGAVRRHEGHDVDVALNGEAGLAALRRHASDLITLDIQMPGKSGLLLYRQLKSEAAFKDIPVLVVTGLTRSDRTAETFIHTFLAADHVPPPQAYLEKPPDN